jgi:hypothetical protein
MGEYYYFFLREMRPTVTGYNESHEGHSAYSLRTLQSDHQHILYG